MSEYLLLARQGGAPIESGLESGLSVILLARRKWWLVLAIIVVDLVLSLTIADTLIRWELEIIRGSM